MRVEVFVETHMHDAHCHLSFVTNGEELAAEAKAAGTLLFANTVTVGEYEAEQQRFAAFDNVRLGLGTHPWWVDDMFDAERFEEMAAHERFIGEIGLDLGKRHLENQPAQLRAFTAIARICAQQAGKVVSLHAVHAAQEVLDIMGQAGALEACACIFHWFTGPSDLLKRAVLAGCFFSVGPRMLATGKGREYVKAIPSKQMLLETDAPPQQGMRYSYAELIAELQKGAEGVAAIKGAEALEVIEQNARTLLA